MFAKKALAAALSTPAIDPVYVEDVFSTYLYTGNGSSQTIQNGIALADGPANGTVLHLRADAASGGTNNTILDSSTNNFTITRNGNVAQGVFSPFAGAGGSAYFDGSGDYLSVPDNAALHLASGDFTVEFWVFPTGLGGTYHYYEHNQNNYELGFYSTSDGKMHADSYTSGGGTNFAITSSAAMTTGNWYHFALVRNGSGSNNVTLYQNGVSVGTATYTGTMSNGSAGGYNVGAYYTGTGNPFAYISNLRVVKGTAVYTAAFTPPASALTAITNTSLLLKFDNANIVDSAPIPNNIELNDNVQISNSIYKYGTGSVYFDGSGDRLVIPASTNLDLHGDFTIEMWVYPTRISSYQILFDTSSSGTAGANMTEAWINASGYVEYYARGAILLTGTTALSTNTWYHIAITKQGSTQRLFINGVADATTTNSTQPNTSYNWYIGDRMASAGSGQYPLQGYIDDLRITKGTARYTSNFTPPAAALPLDTLVESDGGLVWVKGRTEATNSLLANTVNGTTKHLQTSTTGASFDGSSSYITGFSSTGFSVGSSIGIGTNGQTYASWTFRKAEKFFDVVTYTGNGVAGRTVAHNLGSVPGCIIVKRTDAATDWAVYHRSLGGAVYFLLLNLTDARGASTAHWNDTNPTSTVFTVGTNSRVNENGATYVAYLFAHDAGGFGDAGDQSVIKCGSYTGNGSATGPIVDLGWEPQWLLLKRATTSANWVILDNMRGVTTGSIDFSLFPNLVNTEDSANNYLSFTATGFELTGVSTVVNASGSDYIYIAIRRGPMKTPTDATKVFSPTYDSSNLATNEVVTTNFPVDFVINARTGAEHRWLYDRLRGKAASLKTSDSTTEGTQSGFSFESNTSVTSLADWGATVVYALRRAPEFMDVVCYTGNGTAGRTVSHNLGVAPQIIIIKRRDSTSNGRVYFEPLGNTAALLLNSTGASGSGYWNSTSPTSTVFSLSSDASVNTSTATYVAYLFASCPGVSKVGSYTGTGTTLQIDCGFTTSARFVMIKRTDTTGHWQVFDSARGIVSGSSDPWLILSGTTAQSTGNDYLDPYSAGFTITSSAPAAMNASGGTYVYLAIA